jgi:hypothetical protein
MFQNTEEMLAVFNMLLLLVVCDFGSYNLLLRLPIKCNTFLIRWHDQTKLWAVKLEVLAKRRIACHIGRAKYGSPTSGGTRGAERGVE